ncbi:hypothetical protein LB505_006227 [Fusarium chuoi]|nr:hypothetical protein LB505_006227 [Fusarium chuoi]
MPIRSTLDSIKVQMNATRVFLPSSDDIRMLQEELMNHAPANLEVSAVTEACEKQQVTQATRPEDTKRGQSILRLSAHYLNKTLLHRASRSLVKVLTGLRILLSEGSLNLHWKKYGPRYRISPTRIL